MKQKLFCLYNRLKKSFVDEITDIVNQKKGECVFNPPIKIHLPSSEDVYYLYEEVACLQYDAKEKCLYANTQVIEVDDVHTERNEYWTSLRDMSFDELFQIAEKL